MPLEDNVATKSKVPLTLREHIVNMETNAGTINKLATELIAAYHTVCLNYTEERKRRETAESDLYGAQREVARLRLLVRDQGTARQPKDVAQEIIEGIGAQYGLQFARLD